MKTLNLPDANRAVIIDDSIKDGNGIRDALNRSYISSLFIEATGLDAFPDKPFSNIRLVILDLEMVTGGDPRSKASLALSYLSRVVAPNSFYVLVIWTTHLGSELEREFLAMLKDRLPQCYPCVDPVPLSKRDCKNQNDEYSISKINRAIHDQFKKITNYSLFIKWESTINESMSHFLNEVVGGETERSLSKKLHGLAEAYGGKDYRGDIAKNSLLALNDALKGTVDSAVVGKDYAADNAHIFKRVSKLSVDTIAEINTHLMLNPERVLGPGCIFKTPAAIGGRYTGALLDRSGGGAIDVMIDITSICDAAQNKHHFSTYLHGVIVPFEKVSYGHPFSYEFKNPFRYKGRNMKLIVNLRAMETSIKLDGPINFETITDAAGERVTVLRRALPSENGGIKVILKLRDTVVSDLQHRTSGHHSRLGHVLLS